VRKEIREEGFMCKPLGLLKPDNPRAKNDRMGNLSKKKGFVRRGERDLIDVANPGLRKRSQFSGKGRRGTVGLDGGR